LKAGTGKSAGAISATGVLQSPISILRPRQTRVNTGMTDGLMIGSVDRYGPGKEDFVSFASGAQVW